MPGITEEIRELEINQWKEQGLTPTEIEERLKEFDKIFGRDIQNEEEMDHGSREDLERDRLYGRY